MTLRNRRAITALAIGVLTGVIATAAGCSADECTKASEHFSQCIGTNPETNAIHTSPPRCEREYLCSSRCVNNSDCDTLREVYKFDGDAGMSAAGMSDEGMSAAAAIFIACRRQCLSEE